jgi:hypothetical protein
MNLSLRQIVICVTALLLALATVILMSQNAARLGTEPLLVRALLLSVAIVAALIAVYPFNPIFKDKPGAYALTICLPALIPGFVYFLILFPGQAGSGVTAEQLQSQLITDSSSNGIIEVGFSYPIYTPTISVSNHELFTSQVNVFLRMIDGNNESALFRAVRRRIPGSGLSVEASVQGMLSENEEYLFIPLEIPPLRTVTGQVVFIISNLEDGSTFMEALGRAYQAQFELRNPENGELIAEFPLTRI